MGAGSRQPRDIRTNRRREGEGRRETLHGGIGRHRGPGPADGQGIGQRRAQQGADRSAAVSGPEDSLVAGVGASNPAATAYVPQFYRLLRHELACQPSGRPSCRSRALRNLGVGGATSTTLIATQ